MTLIVREDLKAYIDPLTPEEHDALERSLLTEGCRDALVLWGDVLVDGHNRHAICTKHGLPFQTVQNPRFQSLEDVHLWMIDQHLGRRSVSNFQRGLLALRKSEILAERRARATPPAEVTPATQAGGEPAPAAPADQPLNSREAIAKAARLSSSQVVMIEKIQKQAAPEVVAAVRAGSLSINAAAAVATLSAEEQAQAAAAGAGELKQAAKRVREARRKPREAVVAMEAAPAADGAAAPQDQDSVQALRQRVAELTAENQALRRELEALKAGA